MNKQDVINFFDAAAPQWDGEMIRNDQVIGEILDAAGITAGIDVLDVACGTGVLVGDYLAREVASVTGVDISPEMIKIAQGKFSGERARFLCADAEELPNQPLYDRVMVYNAFPHFPNPRRLVEKLSALLRPRGILTVAHGMSREQIGRHHTGAAGKVSIGLPPVEELRDIFADYLTVTTAISDGRMYQVSGRRDGP